MELDTDVEVPQEAIETARKFEVELGPNPTDPRSYTIAFLKQLLVQREKVEHGVLNQYLNKDTPPWWKRLLSSLEEQNRKLLKVETGSIIFTLFCPTEESFMQLSNKTWRAGVVENLQGLLKSLGNICFIFISSIFSI